MADLDNPTVLAKLLLARINAAGGGGVTDHGALTGLTPDDDHPQYILVTGTRAFTGPLLTSSTVDGRDVATDGTKLDTVATNADVTPGVFSTSTNGIVPGPAPLSDTTSYTLRGDGTWGLILYQTNASNLLSGSLADARVTQANVTQHEAAIDHDALSGYFIQEHRRINDAGSSTTELLSSAHLNTRFLGVLALDGTTEMTGDLDMGAQDIVDLGTVDGRDVATDGTKLDGIEAGAEVNDPLGVWAGGKTSGTQAIATLTDATLDAEDIALSGISLATNVLTLANAGTYVFTATLSYSKTTANANCAVQLLLAHDLGAGYTYPLRAFSSGHVRVSGTKGGCSLTKAIVTTSSNEKIKFQHRDTLTGGNVNMDAQGLQVTVIRTA